MERLTEDTAYWKGYHSCKDGKEFEDNPYSENDPDSDEWDFGWMDAYAEDK